MEDWPQHILLPVMRWVHVVCTTLIVGGTLFFEFVVPIAIEDLKNEQQFATFGKARWVFKRVVWISALLLLLSGAVSLFRHWDAYQAHPYRSAMWWSIGHVALGVITIGIALFLTAGRRPPDHQVGWMQFNLVLLLVAIFAANAAHHLRHTHQDHDAQRWQQHQRQLGQPYGGWNTPTTRESP
jgi:hypothetical protein